jgi:hypothetical protein
MDEEVQGNENGDDPTNEEENQRVFVGFHRLGGIALEADNVRLTPQEAFVLAGQLNAHATLIIQQNYMEQAMAARMMAEANPGIILPGK